MPPNCDERQAETPLLFVSYYAALAYCAPVCDEQTLAR